VVGRERVCRRPEHVQAIEVLAKDGVVLVANLGDRPSTFPLRNHDHVVIDVSDVLYIADLKALREQVAPQRIELHVRKRVPQVSDIVWGNAADIHADLSGRDGLEIADLAAERRVQAQGHRLLRKLGCWKA
jgi:hypothetical protein